MRLQRFYRLFMLLQSCGLGFISFRIYRDRPMYSNLHANILSGVEIAPWQYRILPHLMADFLARPGISFYRAFSLFDTFSAVIALWILGYLWFEHLREFVKKDDHTIIVLLIISVVQYWLLWAIFWRQTPYTLPSLLFVTTTLLSFNIIIKQNKILLPSTVILAGTILQTMVRADVAFSVSIGFTLYFFFFDSTSSSRRKRILLLLSLLIGTIAVSGQAYLSLILYPHSDYGPVQVIQIVKNISLSRFWPFSLYMILYILAAWWVVQNWSKLKAQNDLFLAIFFGSLAHLMMWIVVGNIEEVRIFIPLSVPLAHYVAHALIQKFDLSNSRKTASVMS